MQPSREDTLPPMLECERLSSVAPFSQHVGDFLDWLSEQGYILAKHGCPHGYLNAEDCEESKYCRRGEESTALWAQHVHPERLLAEFYEIDLNKVEAERRTLLASLSAGADAS